MVFSNSVPYYITHIITSVVLYCYRLFQLLLYEKIKLFLRKKCSRMANNPSSRVLLLEFNKLTKEPVEGFKGTGNLQLPYAI